MAVVNIKCSCGWEQPVVLGKIKAIKCPKCGNKIKLLPEEEEKPEEEKEVE